MGDRQTAINFAGSADAKSVGLVVADNASSHDSTFVVATNSLNALVDGNTISYTGSDNGSGILDFGSNTGLRVSNNRITGGNGAGTTGIRVAAFSGTPSDGTTVVGNTISGRYNGIRVTDGYTDAYIAEQHRDRQRERRHPGRSPGTSATSCCATRSAPARRMTASRRRGGAQRGHRQHVAPRHGEQRELDSCGHLLAGTVQ